MSNELEGMSQRHNANDFCFEVNLKNKVRSRHSGNYGAAFPLQSLVTVKRFLAMSIKLGWSWRTANAVGLCSTMLIRKNSWPGSGNCTLTDLAEHVSENSVHLWCIEAWRHPELKFWSTKGCRDAFSMQSGHMNLHCHPGNVKYRGTGNLPHQLKEHSTVDLYRATCVAKNFRLCSNLTPWLVIRQEWAMMGTQDCPPPPHLQAAAVPN